MLAIRKEALGPHHRDVAGVLNPLATLVAQQGDVEAALVMHKQALDIFVAARGRGHVNVAECLVDMAGTLELQCRGSEAAAALQEALPILSDSLGPTHPRVLWVHQRLGALADSALTAPSL